MPLDNHGGAEGTFGRHEAHRLHELCRRAGAFASAKLWELFDGDRERLNIAHECIDRHVEGDKPAVIVVKAAGGEEILSYRQISEDSARFAHWLGAKGVGRVTG